MEKNEAEKESLKSSRGNHLLILSRELCGYLGEEHSTLRGMPRPSGTGVLENLKEGRAK